MVKTAQLFKGLDSSRYDYGYLGHVIYKLDPPVEYSTYAGDKRDTSYVVLSQIYQTHVDEKKVFPVNVYGQILDYWSLAQENGTPSDADLLKKLGYEIV